MRFRCTHLGLQQSETLGGGSYEDIWNLVQSKTKDARPILVSAFTLVLQNPLSPELTWIFPMRRS